MSISAPQLCVWDDSNATHTQKNKETKGNGYREEEPVGVKRAGSDETRSGSLDEATVPRA